MKSFFEEYGFVILAAIVVILLIAMASPIGDLVKAQITGIVDSFANKTESKLNAVDAGAITVRATTSGGQVVLTFDAEKKEDTFTYKYYATAKEGVAEWSGSLKVNESEKVRTIYIGKDSAKDVAVGTAADKELKNGTKVEYKIYDSNEVVVASGSIVAKN